MNPLVLTGLEKLLRDTGFDLEPRLVGSWLSGATTGAKVKVYLKQDDLNSSLSYALSESAVFSEPGVQSTSVPVNAPAPDLFYGLAKNGAEAYQVLKRAFQLSRSLPSSPLEEFLIKTVHLPQSTEADSEVRRRIGQDVFRRALRDYWNDRCAVTGLDIPELLRASHMKPWKDSSDVERLSVFNGLLLAPHLDLLFDKGYITFESSGAGIVSSRLKVEQMALLGLDPRTLRVDRLVSEHLSFLSWHRNHVFK